MKSYTNTLFKLYHLQFLIFINIQTFYSTTIINILYLIYHFCVTHFIHNSPNNPFCKYTRLILKRHISALQYLNFQTLCHALYKITLTSKFYFSTLLHLCITNKIILKSNIHAIERLQKTSFDTMLLFWNRREIELHFACPHLKSEWRKKRLQRFIARQMDANPRNAVIVNSMKQFLDEGASDSTAAIFR